MPANRRSVVCKFFPERRLKFSSEEIIQPNRSEDFRVVFAGKVSAQAKQMRKFESD